jgi:O-antigen/teichoic acid export membrane protein
VTQVLPGDPMDPAGGLDADAAATRLVEGAARSRHRDRRILRSGLASVGGQVLSAICTLVTVPLVIDRLSPEAFGVWITLSSLLLLLGFLDLGVGSALVGGIARAQAIGDREEAQRMISSAFFGLVGLSALFGAVFALVHPHVPWGELLGVDSPSVRDEAAAAVVVVVAAILISLPLNVAARAQAGLQEGDTVVLWRTVGIVIQVLAVVALSWAGAGLVWFVAALAAGPVVGSVLNSIALFAGRRRWLHVSRARASLKSFQALGSTGFLFFVLLVSSTVAYQCDALIIAHFRGAADAGAYGVPFRLFMFVPTFVSLALMPLWPAYADAWATGERDWIRRTFRRSVLFAAIANGGAGLALLIVARPVLRLWVGDAVEPSTLFLVSLFFYVLVWGVSGTMAMLLNGCDVVKFQLALSVGMVVVNVSLSIALLDPMGIAGPVVGTVLAQVFVVFIPAFFYIRRLLRPDPEGPVSHDVASQLGRAGA